MLSVTFFEWVGTAAGIVGAAFMSSNTRYSPYGWIGFIIASFNLTIFAWMTDAFGLLTLEAVFFLTNLIGLWRWLLSPYIKRTKERKEQV